MKKRWRYIGAIVILVVIGVGVGYAFKVQNHGVVSKTDLDRPLVVGLVSWPGYAGGIVANGGFEENAQSIFSEKYGQPVRFVLIEDIDARGKAFAKGGPDGVDIVWSTVDFWANELPGFLAGGINPKAFMQVDWSRGGDAIVVGDKISSFEDLKGKKVALVQFTPSQWLFETLLRQSKLTDTDKEALRKNLVFTQDVPSARAAFVSGNVDAAVIWEPDVTQALKRPGAHILTSSRDVPELIADVMVAKEDFLQAHPKAIEAFVRGWFDGTKKANEDPDLAARLLVQNEPLFGDLGADTTRGSLSWVHWADLQDNAAMFGLDGKASRFDSLFASAGKVWQELGAIDSTLAPHDAIDTTILRRVYERP